MRGGEHLIWAAPAAFCHVIPWVSLVGYLCRSLFPFWGAGSFFNHTRNPEQVSGQRTASRAWCLLGFTRLHRGNRPVLENSC